MEVYVTRMLIENKCKTVCVSVSACVYASSAFRATLVQLVRVVREARGSKGKMTEFYGLSTV
jgi:hypothetical protein